jgi:hypothetical protein
VKVIGITSTAVLSLLLAIASPAYTQQEKQGDKQEPQQKRQDQNKQQSDHSRQQQQPRQDQNNQRARQQDNQNNRQQQQPRQDQNNQRARQQDNQNNRQQQQPRQDQNNQRARQQDKQNNRQRSAQQQPQHTQEQRRVEQGAWQEHRSHNWDSDHRNWQQRGGYNGYRIPDDRYRGYFGPRHQFRIYNQPFLVVGGYPRFQYNGYWISLVDPWPQSWTNDWYDTDDVYVTYVDNGYYLHNRRYPTVGLAISISL